MFSLLMVTCFIAGGLAASLCSLAGVLCARMALTTIVFAVAHGVLAGAALSLLVGGDAFILGFSLALVTAIILGPLRDFLNIPIDIASMTLFSIYNALTFLFIVLAPGVVLMTERVSGILWGSVLAITWKHLIILIMLTFAYLLFLYTQHPRILPILFDKKLAEAEGINVKLYTYTFLILTGMIIAVSLKIVGGFLVFSLLYLPAASALQLSENIKHILAISAGVGSTGAILGIISSFIYDLPVGPCIVISTAILFVASSIIGHMRRRAIILAVSR